MPRNTTKKINDGGYIAGGCKKCDGFGMLKERHNPKDCRNGSFCHFHETYDHYYTTRCARYCSYCQKSGHTMLYCRKLKDCVLCGKSGHNPLRCWLYNSIGKWLDRAEELGRCCDCLTLLAADAKKCTNCHNERMYKFHFYRELLTKESQTEEDSSIVQESQTELQERQSTIEDQRIQIEELNNKISSLEDKLESSITAINELNLNCKIL